MSNELVKHESQVIAPITDQTIKDYLFGSETKLTHEQQVLFIKTAVASNLNPFKREIYAVPYEEKWYNKATGRKESYSPPRYKLSMPTGYEVYLKRAERLSSLDGWEVTTEGKGNDLVAKITIWRKDRGHPFKHEVKFSEYNQENAMWRNKPETMLKKVVTAQGFRLYFPDEMGGLPYTADELPDEMTMAKNPNEPFVPAEYKLKSIPVPKQENKSEQVITITAEVIHDDVKRPTQEEVLANDVADLVSRMQVAGIFTEKQIETASHIKTRGMLELGERKFELMMKNESKKEGEE